MALGQEIAGIFVRLGADISDFRKGMESATREIHSVGKKMENVGRTMSVAITAPLALAGGAAIKTAADIEQTQIAFETMLGSADKAKKTLEGLFKFTATTPFQFEQVSKAAKSLLAFGVSADEVQANLKALGDVASGVNMPLTEIAQIYGKAKVQGRLFAEDINQLTGRGIPIIQELAKQFGVAESEVKKLVESGVVGFANIEKAFQDMTSSGGRFEGLMAAQSQSISGLFSTMKDNITLTLASIGEEIEKSVGLKDLLRDAIELTKGLAKGFSDLSPPVKKFIIIGGGIMAAVGPALVALGAFSTTVLPALIAGFTALTGPIGVVIAALGGLTAAYFALSNAGDNLSRSEALTKPLDELLDKRSELEQKLPQLKKKLEDLKSAGDVYGGTTFKVRDEIHQVEEELRNVRQAIREKQIAEKEQRLAAIKGAQEQAEAEAALKASTDAATSGIEEQTGKLPKLEAELQKATEALNALPEGATDADFARINRQITDLTGKIERLKSVTLTSIAPIEKVESQGSTEISTEEFNPIPQRSADAAIKRAKDVKDSFSELGSVTIETTQVMQAAIVDMAATVGQSFANLVTNTSSVGGFFKGILGVVADFGKQLGKLIVAQGAAMLALKSTLFKNPVAAIVAGTALIAASSVMGNLLKQGPAVPGFANGVTDFRGGMAIVGEKGPELVNLPRGSDVIPNHKLAGLGNAGMGRVEFEIRGDKLYGVLENYNTKAGKLF